MTTQKKLLIVEDHQDTLAVYLLVLERKGYDIRLAWNGEEGLARFNSWQPDLVVLDEMLPRLTGTELLEKIRENRIECSCDYGCRETPILTSSSDV